MGEGALKVVSSKRAWAIAAVITLLLFLLRPGASQLKSRVIVSISSGVGRPVDIGSVKIQLLPRPGFDLENLVVYDDAAFGAEPILRAGEVTAALRLSSLVRGRLEIARLDMSEPSLNLVRKPDGHWNVETLLEHAVRVPLAPTAKARLEPRPGFPYIEGSAGRINFMVGREKKPYAMTNADFSLWQESEDTWGVRLKAQPTRADLNLNDTGILRVSGTWQRAAALRDTPLNFTAEWDRAQVGQLTKFLTGVDQGWRGGVQLEVKLSGTAAKLVIAGDSSIQDFRRYDITSGDALRLAAHCDAIYSSIDRLFSQLICNTPIGDGLVSLKGSAGLPGSHNYSLVLNAERVPASAVIALVRRAKKNLPDDLAAQGTLSGNIALERSAEQSISRFEGRGEIKGFRIASLANNTEISPETIPFAFTDRPSSLRFAATARALHKKFPELAFGTGAQVVIGPFSAGVGKLAAAGWIDRGGYQFLLAGESEIGKMLLAARTAGIPVLQTTATGQVQQSDIQIRGFWPGWGSGPQSFSGPQITGTAKLRTARIAVRGTDTPAEVLSADVRLLPDTVKVEKLSAKVAGSVWTGSLDLPRGCGTPGQCEIHFNLRSNQAALGDLNSWFNPSPKPRPWYSMLQAGAATSSFFASLRASGRIAAEVFQIHGVTAKRVEAKVALDSGHLQITDLSADILGGTCRGEWATDFRAKPAISTGSGSVTGVSLADLAQIMKDPWISGTASGTYQLTANGASAAEFWQSAVGVVRFEARNGVLPHLSIDDPEPLKFEDFSGQARLQGREIEIKNATIDTAAGAFVLSGIASAKREIQFKLLPSASGSPGYAISGTLAEPHVSALSTAEQARLKR